MIAFFSLLVLDFFRIIFEFFRFFIFFINISFSTIFIVSFKDLSRVKAGFKSIPLQFYFEIAGLASAEMWREIQNMAREERF